MSIKDCTSVKDLWIEQNLREQAHQQGVAPVAMPKRTVLVSDFSGLRFDARITGKEIAMVVHTSRVLNKVCITRGWTERVYSPTAASWARLERLNGQGV